MCNLCISSYRFPVVIRLLHMEITLVDYVHFITNTRESCFVGHKCCRISFCLFVFSDIEK